MSKQIKQQMTDELAKRFAEVTDCVVVDPTRLDGTSANQLRAEMNASGMRMMVVKNSLARRAFSGLPIAPVSELLKESCAIAWGGDSVVDLAKLLTAKLKDLPALAIKGAVMDGQVLDAAGAAGLAKLPSKAEMRSQLVGLALSPGGRLAGAILAAGANIAAVLKGRIEQLEKAEGGQPAAA